MGRKMVDIVGKVSGKLTVVEYHGRDFDGKPLWKCKCECGGLSIVRGGNLYGQTKSCGCSQESEYKYKNYALYTTWIRMKSRCKISEYYSDIGICEGWKDYYRFEEDMYESYIKHTDTFGAKETTLDRINPYIGYRKDNCRWATKAEQNRNQRHNFKGKRYEERAITT